MFTLSNPSLHFALDPASSSWSLFTQTSETPSIEGVRLNGLFRFPEFNWPHLGGLRAWQWRGRLADADIFKRKQESPHGTLDALICRVVSGIDSLSITVEFALPQEKPFLLIRIRVRNAGTKAFRVVRLNPLFAGLLHRGGVLQLSARAAPPTFFSNGWQSWSFAGALTARRRQPHTNIGLFQGPNNHNPHTPVSEVRGQFSSDMFGVMAEPKNCNAIIAGFISQREQFGSIDFVADPLSPSLRLRAQCDDVIVPAGEELQTDWAYVQLLPEYGRDPLADYAEAVACENCARVPKETPVGWCSWYHYFDKVTEADVRSNLDYIAANRDRLPLSLVQLDDGFESNVGDWFGTNAKFPAGLRALADSIRERSLTPGLWLAPFIAKPDSRLAREHPDWFVRNRVGLPSSAGFVFDTFAWGLDTTHPAVQDHTRKLIGTAVKEWGYPYLKLDFLYAAALPGWRHDRTRTRAQALRTGLELIREAAGPDAFLLGCGCPLGAAVGVVDAMRIGADVDPRWRPSFRGVSFPFRDEPAMPSARSAIRNSITRAPLHRRWWLNDPDCLLVRETTQLTLDEVIALASVIALSGGMFLVSDDLNSLAPERRRIVESLLPIIEGRDVPMERLYVHDWLEKEMPELLELPLRGAVGEWSVFGVFNWSDSRAVRTLPIRTDSHVRDFWCQTYQRTGSDVAFELSPHRGRLFAVRPVGSAPQFVGSSFHFSQGAEIEEWDGTDRAVRFVINLNRAAEGEALISLPHPPAPSPVVNVHTTREGMPTPLPRSAFFRVGEGLGVRVPFTVNRRAEIKVTW